MRSRKETWSGLGRGGCRRIPGDIRTRGSVHRWSHPPTSFVTHKPCVCSWILVSSALEDAQFRKADAFLSFVDGHLPRSETLELPPFEEREICDFEKKKNELSTALGLDGWGLAFTEQAFEVWWATE